MRRVIDRILTSVASLALLGFFRTVDVEGRSHLPERGRPVLVVANHFNGFVDPVALVKVLKRLPRFLAKATLWKVRPARPLLAVAGLIPVHRRVDSDDEPGTDIDAANESSFAAAHRALARGDLVGIFPEGTTHDEARMAEVRTGAARIALGARAAGVQGLTVLPVGLLFEDKVALRSRLLVRVGTPIEIDELVPQLPHDSDGGEDDRAAVRALTDRIDHDLRSVSPDFASVRDRDTCRVAADIATRVEARSRSDAVRLAERERLAQRLGRLPDGALERLRAEVADYQLELSTLGVTDAELAAGTDRRRLLIRIVVTAIAVALLLPFAYTAAVVNAVPVLLVWLAGRRVDAPVSKGTVRLLTALVAFPAAWLIAAAIRVDGALPVIGLAALFALGGLVAVRLAEVVLGLVADLWGWQRATERKRGVAAMQGRRHELVGRIIDASRSWPDHPPDAPRGTGDDARAPQRLGD